MRARTYSDYYMVGVVWLDGDEISRHHPELVMIDGEDECCVSGGIDHPHKVLNSLIFVRCRSKDFTYGGMVNYTF